jgi:DNA-binding NarL/FixJ family response regulator
MYASAPDRGVARPGEPAGTQRTAPISVLIVVEVCLYRDGLAHALAQWPQLHVLGSVADAGEAGAAIRDLQPEVVLLDPGSDPESPESALVPLIREAAPRARVVALGVREEEPDVLRCAATGMAGYVPRDGSIVELVAAIESAANDELRCSPRIAGSLFRRVALLSERRHDSPLAALTRREQEIVRLIDQGLSNKQIAQQLRIELSTVKNHVHNLLRKLQASRRGHAAAQVRRPPGAARR